MGILLSIKTLYILQFPVCKAINEYLFIYLKFESSYKYYTALYLCT